jgi:hypothetical protein
MDLLRPDIDGVYSRLLKEKDCCELANELDIGHRKCVTGYLRRLKARECEASDGIRVNLETLSDEHLEGLYCFVKALALLERFDEC